LSHGFIRLLSLATACTFGLAVAASAHVELDATLDAQQETSAVNLMGHDPTGSATLVFDFDTNTIQYDVFATDLTGPVVEAHLHPGVRGVSGERLACCTLAAAVGTDPVAISGTTSQLDPAQVEALFSEGLYVNVHTVANPAGEIRGQITLREGRCDCTGPRKEFTRCVKRAIRSFAREDKRSAEAKALKKAVKRSFCGRRKAPRKAVGCCLGITPVENVVTGNICAAVPQAKCDKFGGISKGEGSDCAEPFCSPSGAFVDDSPPF
jgi:hypothetical protein